MFAGVKGALTTSAPARSALNRAGRVAIWSRPPFTSGMTFAGHRARKRFGQHWLTDASVLDRIVAAAAIEPGEPLLEVGPGRGALTERLLASPAGSLLAKIGRAHV